MGDDLRVVNAARVSFAKESALVEEKYTEVEDHALFGMMEYPCVHKVLSERDQKLIRYLATHGHWTPFSHPQITLRETVPIFVARQRFKHMVGFTYNEVSRRYVDDEPEFFTPDAWRKRAENKKQGSSSETQPVNPTLIRQHNEACLDTYNKLLEIGVAPEQARMVLPQSMFTSYYVTGSLAAWARAYKLRTDEHAQKEIRDLAAQWDEIIRPLFPVSWEALTQA